jgi:hypothetical protein
MQARARAFGPITPVADDLVTEARDYLLKPSIVKRHLMRRSLANCSRHRLVNLQCKARFNIRHRVAN